MIYDSGGNAAEAYDGNDDELCSVFDLSGEFVPLYTLAFDQDFSKTTANLNYWDSRSGPYPSNNPWQYNLPENAFLADYNMVEKCEKSDENKAEYGFYWTGAFMRTRNKFEFEYGTVEARMKFPESPKYYHSALWTFASEPGEMDIAEADTGRVSASAHWGNENGEIISQLVGYYTVDPSAYHVYRMDWSKDKIRFRCDGKLMGSFSVANADAGVFNSFRQPHYLIVNINPKSLSYNTYDAGTYVETRVDYIKVYAKNYSIVT